ncbi:hypothetical protein Ssi02_00380 [Sinosporangium siamense]|uniref:non-specific serine/threonine protein kinase n=2 Tax=Sinosporangium siamense TaxID=1367973 RepID=A0A919V5D3_9ACTN|nr:hypothetical protein Ssi02_00380 [Sinosporangium siamense]
MRRDQDFLLRFRSETALMVGLDDSRVVRLYEYVETATRAALVMELVDGVPLRAVLDRHGRTDAEAAIAQFKTVLLGLAAVHEVGLVHGNHRPENVLVQADGLGRIGDLGLAAFPGADRGRDEPFPRYGEPAYAAPELWAGEPPSVASDLYAATCVFFECLTGRTPYGTARPDGRPSLDDVPASVRGLVGRGLATEPDDRPQSAREFLQELGAAAVAAHGPEWEKRGRRRLAETATAMALDFPLARPITRRRTPVTRLAGRVSRVRPRGYGVMVAAIMAVTVTIVLLVADLDKVERDGGTFLAPSPRQQEQAEPEPMKAAAPTAGPATSRAAPYQRVPSPLVTQAPGQAAPAPSPARVTSARITSWDGSDGSMLIRTESMGPVRLSVMFTRRDGTGAVRTLHTDTVTLSGKTDYSVDVAYKFARIACGTYAHLGVVLMTDRAALNGPQVTEIRAEGRKCPPRTPAPEPEPSEEPEEPEESGDPEEPEEPATEHNSAPHGEHRGIESVE